MTEDFDTALRSILGQLIEAREDQNDADKRLQDYRAAKRPPEVPNEFEDVDAFLDYHRRQSYENDLRQHENALKKARIGVRGRCRPAPAFPARECALTLHLPRRTE